MKELKPILDGINKLKISQKNRFFLALAIALIWLINSISILILAVKLPDFEWVINQILRLFAR